MFVLQHYESIPAVLVPVLQFGPPGTGYNEPIRILLPASVLTDAAIVLGVYGLHWAGLF